MDFLYLNIVGYVALVSSMCLILFNTEVRQQFFDMHGYFPLLTKIDLVYSAHGLLLTSVSISQLFLSCWGFKKRTTSSKRITRIIITFVLSTIAILYSIVGTTKITSLHDSNTDQKSLQAFTLLDLAVMLSYIKIFLSLIKYIPQLLHNHRRKSVLGFSMFTIFLDCTGGILSVSQLFLDAYIATGHLSMDILISNGGKLWLSFVTLFFDGCFVYQWLRFEKFAAMETKQCDLVV